MIVETPPALMRAIDAVEGGAPSQGWRPTAALAELFELFTRERQRVRRFAYLDDPRLRSAYLRYHVPINVARATCVLRHARALYPALAELRDVVDLGAGPGSASIASLLELPDRGTLRLGLHDRSKAALALASRLIAQISAELGDDGPGAIGAPAGVRCRTTTLPRFPAIERPSLVWLAMVLNELGVGERGGVDAGELVRHVSKRVPAGSVLLVIEPALRAPGRALLRLHDALCDAGGWRVIAPCTHQLRCPLLAASGRPWCHFHFEWDAPRAVRELARAARLETSRVSLAYLAIAREGDSRSDRGSAGAGGRERLASARDEWTAARVIGDPMAIRGDQTGVYTCEEGVRRVERVERVALARGDLIRRRRDAARGRLELVRPWRGAPRAEDPAPSGGGR